MRYSSAPGHIEVYTEDGAQMLSENCALRLHGQESRSMEQKGFKVIARSEYGANRFKAPLFTGRDYTEYQSFLLRSSSEDGPMTRMRDSILTSLARDTGRALSGKRNCACSTSTANTGATTTCASASAPP